VRTIGVVTVGRSDYGILAPVVRRIEADERVRLALIVSGSHFVAEHGRTVAEIEADGFSIAARVPFAPTDDDDRSVAAAIGAGTIALADAVADIRPDLLLVAGDRFELLAVAAAALSAGIPLAQLHGGELSEGSFDDSVRHALTKLSHLHFASAEPHALRIRQLGEEPWRVFVTGAPALDEIAQTEMLGVGELAQRIGLALEPPPLLVTYHAATLDDTGVEDRFLELLAALERVQMPVVFTYPNADPGGSLIRELIDAFVTASDSTVAVASLGRRAYYSLMGVAAAMVGNSSSGLVEGPSLRLPVVNVGIRQDGRLRAPNVIDAADDRASIEAAIKRAASPEFRAGLSSIVNPYGDGRASERIVEVLATVELGHSLLVKRFQDADA
jgi:UDP-hydrolysing UDP-N-acetyl-D-glucosamine 2-epimerase